jgi:hypothetical protein
MATKKKVSEEVIEEAVVTDVVETTKEVVTNEVISEREYKLKLFSNIPVELVDDATKIAVENLGGGEVYVTNEVIGYDNREVIAVGQSMTFDTGIVLFAETRPTVKVTQLK